ncbi:MAG: sigma-E factor regulatory protein RseB domain-containing protein [Planctomycetota bacterium]|nr:sigma-E factor regulatory protein RseB domain-containing protein [Planctomycetota bacterium]
MNRSFFFHMLSFLILLGTSGMTYGLLSEEAEKREGRRKKASLLESIRKSRREKSFEGVSTVKTNVHGTEYITRMEIYRSGTDRQIHLLDLQGGKTRPRHGNRRMGGGMASLFQPGSFRRARLQNPNDIAKNYQILLGEEVFVGGRRGQSIRIIPRSDDRPAYLLVSDKENSFPLQFAVMGSKGEVAYEKKFDSIRFLSGEYRGRKHRKRVDQPRWGSITQEKISFDQNPTFGFPVWIPKVLPVGFSLTDSMRMNINTGPIKMEVVYSIYSDGIALFSLLQFSNENPVWKMMKTFFPASKEGEGIFTRKVSLGIGSAFILEMNGTVVVLAGNIWAEALQKTAESLKPYMGDPS